MAFPPYFKDSVDEIDAALFSGDLMVNEAARKEFTELLARWGRKMVEWEKLVGDPEFQEDLKKDAEEYA